MSDRCLHALRNELNVLAVGVLLLRRELEYSDRRELHEALDRMERALGHCVDLLAVSDAGPRPAG
ncbi:hypothetical protein [Pseudoxanthomonas mexicana]|uniref:hypothetical protein n=1 Tax=Pseudoxanthomonas mexicana TaxID=128785 RepID=UPI00209EA044|nr:hypothetical protein [Pseudoxanthomonas mexicana]MCP1582021.1 hypothetical protein [Pseudoxanthomonas mexicana]